MWYRIFCRSDTQMSPAALLEHLQSIGLAVEGHFNGDDLGWTAAELRLGIGSPVFIERYLTKEDEIRNDLNTWAGFLETCDYSPNHVMMMERVIQTAQMITLQKPIDHSDEIILDRLCLETCQFLARQADGIYQIDGEGWYTADGEVLLKE
ncbi:MAG: hypothetical protein K8T89_10600 [Planctomycetes bacterium]|nr:hypothetical protein [Planctomycetota bacterium]